MKKFIMIIAAIAATLSFTSCEKPWADGDPSQDHVYFIGFTWGDTSSNFNGNKVVFNVDKGHVVDIPYQFESSFTRKYDVETYFYVKGDLVLGTDYAIVDAEGHPLTQEADGGYKVVWPNAVKGNQPIHFKALNGATGTVQLRTIPEDHVTPSANDLDTLIQHEEDNYTVRIFSQNYFVTVNIK